jgi:superfamily II DNA or RNA helicase
VRPYPIPGAAWNAGTFGDERAVGLRRGGSDDQLGDRLATIFVALTASTALPVEVRRQRQFGPTLLVADEVHRLGADQLSHLLNAPFAATLGLSATPERRYDDGMEQHVFSAVGEVVYQYAYHQGLEDDVISPFEIAFVSVDFTPVEQGETLASGRASRRASRTRSSACDLATASSSPSSTINVAQALRRSWKRSRRRGSPLQGGVERPSQIA